MTTLAPRLLAWHGRHGRHDLPWQRPRSSYRVWIAEIMLQQTQVKTASGYFERFVARFPDLPTLAAADEDAVLALWSGLGYYRRARFLHRTAQLCMQRHDGELPRSAQELAALPGIGRSTAHAILAQAHGQPLAILDGNVKRVLSRYHAVHGWAGTAAVERELWALAERHTPSAQVADYTQAIMDLGATVCTRARPRCALCPLAEDCLARRQGLIPALPQPRPRKLIPVRQVCMLLLYDRQGRVLLERRSGQGVWPRLWSLPESSDEGAAGEAARLALVGDTRPRPLAAFEHAFSHYRLCVRPLLWAAVSPHQGIADNDDLRWCAAEDWAGMGLPAPVRRLLLSIKPESETCPA
ncbi:MAG TPA: A/G-specific adenine glycosylase [Rhodanobacteraceae bacterium]|nr:A/G-specific adenine glycosylase [Rhodanobacteraceae bacterium]